MGKKGPRKAKGKKAKTKQAKAPHPTKVAPDWEEFQKLVARIEHQVAPKGAVVRSPDKIPDVDTGQLREVDATVQYAVGTVPVLLAFECRRREEREDVTWIEQLATKHRSIRASRVIAVSAAGFSGPAIEKAKRLGIDLRTVSDISAEEIGRWMIQKAQLKGQLTRIAVLDATIQFEGKDKEPTPETAAAMERDRFNARILADEKGRLHSIQDVVAFIHDKGIPRPPKEGATFTLPITFTPDTPLFVATTDGRAKVRAISLILKVKHEGDEPIALERVHDYSGPDGPKRYVGEGHWQSPKLPDSYVVLASRAPDDPDLPKPAAPKATSP
jgi:hypothetical protein